MNVRQYFTACDEYLKDYVEVLTSTDHQVLRAAWMKYSVLDLYNLNKEAKEKVHNLIAKCVEEAESKGVEQEILAAYEQAETLYVEAEAVYQEFDHKGDKVGLLLKQKFEKYELLSGTRYNPYTSKKESFLREKRYKQEAKEREEARKKREEEARSRYSGSGSGGYSGGGRSHTTTGFSKKDLAIVEINRILKANRVPILNLNPERAEVRSAHMALVRKFHPDVNPGNKAAEETLKTINNLFDNLK